ncbi:uncharacterized protein A4U43_C01F10790 [Asparagus officinalis]|uniref:DYW domain-containing protein n=1 Tax=Asparagus officinalis TaxID=4686 RepID=A0A5P1FS80_ASPOF|nr:pentatricopeptide repeat-containing protein At4g21065-like [Asparagus officinalis]ONK79849.1 uncharacterized protein A4U43_C01F10790 [Asparagus officinalis]
MLLINSKHQWPTPRSLRQSLQLLAQILTTGSLHSPPSSTHLLKSLSDPEAGSLSLSLTLFSQIPSPSTFHYNTLILAFSRSHRPLDSILSFRQMHRESVPFDPYTFRFLFKSCGRLGSILEGRLAHCLFVKLFSDLGSWVLNALIQMYIEFGLLGDARRVFVGIEVKDVVSWTTMMGGLVKCGMLEEAKKLFDEMPERNVVSWTSMIGGFSKARRASESIELFKRMLADGIVPDSAAMVSALSACTQLRDLEYGKWVHRLIDQERILVNDNLAAALVDMYAKCGDIEGAHQYFHLMGRKILPAWNALIDGYCKIGNIDAARSLFNQMGNRDIISYNSMMTGYIHSSRLNEALLLFTELRASHLCPDKFTIVGLLTACASSGSLILGRAMHAYVESCSIEPDIFIGTALVDMYSKCGKMDQAKLVFDRMSRRDVLTWTAIITGFAMNGMGKIALEHFNKMIEEGIRPNAVAYIGVLNACSHSGLIEEGRKYFKEMRDSHNIDPEIEHYGCMVDLFGRCGQLDEAEQIIKEMPMKPNAVIWGSLLNSCRVHKNTDLAKAVAKRVLQLEPDLDAGYVQLYNIYMDSGRKIDASRIRRLMEERGIRKIAGFSSIAVGGKVYKFIAGNRTHPESAEIEEMMREITRRLKEAGYSPMISRVSVEMDEEEKEQALFGHSERMAIAFGIMRLGANVPIHIVKNLRVCEDCHDVIKMIAKIWRRDIVVRDRSRFHHFRHGECSCNDFW